MQKFKNKYAQPQNNWFMFLKWITGNLPIDTHHYSQEISNRDIPKKIETSSVIWNPDPKKIQVTWVGHSTFLIQYGGITILTDPVFSNRISPFVYFGGLKRLYPPGLTLENLPKIDIVLLSHNHHDHLDLLSIKKLPKDAQYFCPVGVSKYITRFDKQHVTEMNWDDHVTHHTENTSLDIHFVSSQHWSGRKIIDMNKTLWGGYVFKIQDKAFYFVGDTGYSPEFKEIQNIAPVIHCAFIPIGAYNPRQILKVQHTDPFEAIQIHKDINSQFSIGMHFATFRLSQEPTGEPATIIKHESSKLTHPFITMNFGETREI